MGAVVLNPNDLGTQVVVTKQPSDTEETVFGGFVYGFGLVVAVENNAGQIDPFVQQAHITIALKSDPGGGVLQQPGSATPLTLQVSDGLAIFEGLTVDAPGQGYTIQVRNDIGLTFPVTNPFNVSGPATKLVVTTQPPTSAGAGVPFTVSVSAEDANGIVVPIFDDPIQLAILANPPGNGVLNGTNPFGALYGTATFTDFSIDQAGVGYTLQATDPAANATVTAGATAKFNITAGPATQFKFESTGEPPATATAGQNFASPAPIVVDAEDRFGQLATSYTGPVMIALANNATGTLIGTLTVNADKGVATFSNLAITTVGTYQLQASNTGLTSAT